ncbi:MAG TPA: carboxypeptidase regulatory-like domain-containing protein [Terriglobales bacterium]|nr:carboxypeptidase regulatory-like domain-containing protein [Terriglobales bacterium]
MSRVLNFKAFVWVFSLFAIVAFSFGLVYGQAISGNVVGTVVDSSGAAIVGADVTARNSATGVVWTGKTNNTGEYRFDNLPIGAYDINAKASGFQTTTLHVDVQLNKSGTANITMTPGSASTTVEVAGVAETLDTTTAQIQTTFESKTLEDLPTANLGVNTTTGLNLGVLNLSMLDAGASSTGGLGAGVGPALSGERPRDNNFTIEGVDNNNKTVTGPLVYVPADAVANFTVLQNQFSPEFGHSNGGQFNIVVKSGTNSYHGTAYEYFQNRNLNAIDQDVVNSTTPGQPVINPRFDSNRYGGQFGGPIFKNKLFFFANYEYNEVGQASVPGAPLLAPTSAGYAAMLALPGVSTANVQALQKWVQAPSATSSVVVGGASIPVGTLPILAPNFTNFKALTTAVDYDISERDQIRGRYIYNQSAALDTGAQLPAFFTPLVQPFHLATISEYHTFTPAVTNEFRVGFNRFAQNFVVGKQTFLPTLDAFPNITINDLGDLNVGPDPNAPQYAIQNTYQAVDNVTWVKGANTLTFGAEYRKYISPQKFIQRSRGDYVYSSLDQFAFDGIPGGSVAERSFGNVGYSGDQHAIYGFVNDIWKVKRNVSVNLGLRYEYTSTPYGWTQQSLNSVSDVPGLITFGSPKAPTKDFMPRVGFAYSPGTSGATSIRGGFGLGYDVLYDNIGVLERPPQIGSTVDCPPTCVPGSGGFLAKGGIPPENLSGITVLQPAAARAATSAYLPNNVKYPYSETWNLGVQHVFAKDYTADIRYVGTRGVDLNVQNRLNFVSGAGPGHEVPTFINPPSPATVAGLTTAWASADPGCNDGTPNTCPSGAGDEPGTLSYGYNDVGTGPGGFYDPRYLNAGFTSAITAYEPWGASTYHGLQTQLNRRFSNGLQLQAAYTWSHMIDNSTADFFSTVIAPRRPQDFRDLQAERSNSILDHRHRFTISTIYDAQWYKHDPSWFKRNLLGNYEIAPVFTWESGQWGTVQSGQDSNLNADAASDRAIYNPRGVPGTGSDVVPITNNTACGLPPCIVGWQAVNPNAQYIIAGFGTVPTAPRNTIQTPPINNWDVTLSKHIYATERVHFDLMASFLNAFNHPQFVTGSPDQGQPISDAGSQRNYFIPNSPNFENARLSFPSNARQSVLGLKISF